MRCKYLEQDYEQKMHGGVAFYDGKPVLVSATRGIINITDFPEQRERGRVIEKDDPLLDLSSPKLGYVNFKNGAYYIVRKPERKYKQTLTYGAISFWDPSTEKPVNASAEAIFFSKEFAAMLLGVYPKVEDVIKTLNNENSKVKARAIDRDVCIAKDSYDIIRVYYKFDEVGIINQNETTVRVPKSELSWVISKYLRNYGWQVD